MERLEVTWSQRVSYAICAIALVCTLSLYRSRESTQPLSVAQQHWEAIVAENPELLATRYSDHAVLQYSYGVSDLNEVYQGQSIYSAWRQFFWQYQIKNFQVVQQQQRDQGVAAQIQITAQSHWGAVVTLSMSYQVQFDKSGKIIKEVWQTNPESSV